MDTMHYYGLDVNNYHLVADDWACAVIVESRLEGMSKEEAKTSLNAIISMKSSHAHFDLKKLGELIDKAIAQIKKGIIALRSNDSSIWEALPAIKDFAARIDGMRFASNIHGRFLDFIEDWYWAVQ